MGRSPVPSWAAPRLLAAVLEGAWRRAPSPPDMTPAILDRITPDLLRSGAAALAWWRVRRSPLRDSAAGRRLRQAYHHHGLAAVLHARNLAQVLERLDEAGVEPIVVKGPAAARLYPERGLRPFGDLDLCVRPDQVRAAALVLDGWRGAYSPVDLHRGFRGLDERGWDRLSARSEVVPLAGRAVRVLGPEDHLRVVCLHQLKHGVSSPLWLCDVAVAVEGRPATFDWDRALGPDRRRADWVACTIGLAHQLLGASVDGTPVAARARRLPDWLLPSVLAEWTRTRPGLASAAPAWRLLVARAPATLRGYWPNAVAATVHLGRPFSGFPRPPLQAADAVARLLRFCLRRLAARRPGLASE